MEELQFAVRFARLYLTSADRRLLTKQAAFLEALISPEAPKFNGKVFSEAEGIVAGIVAFFDKTINERIEPDLKNIERIVARFGSQNNFEIQLVFILPVSSSDTATELEAYVTWVYSTYGAAISAPRAGPGLRNKAVSESADTWGLFFATVKSRQSSTAPVLEFPAGDSYFDIFAPTTAAAWTNTSIVPTHPRLCQNWDTQDRDRIRRGCWPWLKFVAARGVVNDDLIARYAAHDDSLPRVEVQYADGTSETWGSLVYEGAGSGRLSASTRLHAAVDARRVPAVEKHEVKEVEAVDLSLQDMSIQDAEMNFGTRLCANGAISYLNKLVEAGEATKDWALSERVRDVIAAPDAATCGDLVDIIHSVASIFSFEDLKDSGNIHAAVGIPIILGLTWDRMSDESLMTAAHVTLALPPQAFYSDHANLSPALEALGKNFPHIDPDAFNAWADSDLVIKALLAFDKTPDEKSIWQTCVERFSKGLSTTLLVPAVAAPALSISHWMITGVYFDGPGRQIRGLIGDPRWDIKPFRTTLMSLLLVRYAARRVDASSEMIAPDVHNISLSMFDQQGSLACGAAVMAMIACNIGLKSCDGSRWIAPLANDLPQDSEKAIRWFLAKRAQITLDNVRYRGVIDDWTKPAVAMTDEGRIETAANQILARLGEDGFDWKMLVRASEIDDRLKPALFTRLQDVLEPVVTKEEELSWVVESKVDDGGDDEREAKFRTFLSEGKLEEAIDELHEILSQERRARLANELQASFGGKGVRTHPAAW